MKKQWLCAVVILASFFLGDAVASANNVLTDLRLQMRRYSHWGPNYGCHSNFGRHGFHCHDCFMQWQPLRTTMHGSVLPPGMHHSPPIHNPRLWLAPGTPNWSPHGTLYGPDPGPDALRVAQAGVVVDGAPGMLLPYMTVPEGIPPYAATNPAPAHILERGNGVGTARP